MATKTKAPQPQRPRNLWVCSAFLRKKFNLQKRLSRWKSPSTISTMSRWWQRNQCWTQRQRRSRCDTNKIYKKQRNNFHSLRKMRNNQVLQNLSTLLLLLTRQHCSTKKIKRIRNQYLNHCRKEPPTNRNRRTDKREIVKEKNKGKGKEIEKEKEKGKRRERGRGRGRERRKGKGNSWGGRRGRGRRRRRKLWGIKGRIRRLKGTGGGRRPGGRGIGARVRRRGNVPGKRKEGVNLRHPHLLPRLLRPLDLIVWMKKQKLSRCSEKLVLWRTTMLSKNCTRSETKKESLSLEFQIYLDKIAILTESLRKRKDLKEKGKEGNLKEEKWKWKKRNIIDS